MLEEFFRARRVLEDFQELPEPAVLLPLRTALLVLPVCSDAEFRNLVHRPGAHLDFDALVFGSDDACVDGTVAVRLGNSEVVLEAARPATVVAVHDSGGVGA